MAKILIFEPETRYRVLLRYILEGINHRVLDAGSGEDIPVLLAADTPDLVVLGGGVTLGLDGLGLLPRIHSLMVRSAMSQRHKDFRLVASQLGDAAGMLGAASVVWQEVGATR